MIIVFLLGGLIGTISAIAGVAMHGLQLHIALFNYFAGALPTISGTFFMVQLARMYPRLFRFLRQQ